MVEHTIEDLDIQIPNQFLIGSYDLADSNSLYSNSPMFKLAELQLDTDAIISLDSYSINEASHNMTIEDELYINFLKIEKTLNSSLYDDESSINLINSSISKNLENLNFNSQFHYFMFLKYWELSLSILSQSTAVNKRSVLENYLLILFQFNDFPQKINILGNNQFNQIFKKLSIYLVKNSIDIEILFKDLKTNNEVFKNCIKYIIFFHSNKFKNDSLISSFNSILKNYLTSCKFPKANEKNDNLDLFYKTANYILENFEVNSIFTSVMITESISKSFQSIEIVKYWLFKKINQSNKEQEEETIKIISIFKTYSSYVDILKIHNKGKIYDLIDLIETYIKFINYLIDLKINKKLFDLIIKYINEIDDLINNNLINSLSISKNFKKLNDFLKLKLSYYYYQLGNFAKFNCRYFKTNYNDLINKIEISKNNYELSIDFLNSIKNFENFNNINSPIFNFANYFFEYSICLIKLNNIKDSIKFIKFAIRLNPSNLKYSNLYILLSSSRDETYLKTMEQCQQIIENLNSYIDSNNVNTLSSIEKWDIIQMYMTYISLIEAIDGINEAIQNVPRLFYVINKLIFPNTGSKEKKDSTKSSVALPRLAGTSANGNIPHTQKNNTNSASAILTSSPHEMTSNRPSFSNPGDDFSVSEMSINDTSSKNLSILKKIKSSNKVATSKITSKISHIRNKSDLRHGSHSKSNGSANGDANTIEFHKLSDSERKKLQECWIWTSKLYQKAKLTIEAENAIKEAENCYPPNFKTHSRLSALLINNNNKLSFQELEISLDEKEDGNIEAVLNLVQLTLIYKPLETDNDDNYGNEIFISLKDWQSSLSRSKYYLELLTSRYELFQYSEIHYYLSLIYEIIGDNEQLENCLWRSIALEEARPLRHWDSILTIP